MRAVFQQLPPAKRRGDSLDHGVVNGRRGGGQDWVTWSPGAAVAFARRAECGLPYSFQRRPLDSVHE
jgi:hypothetical protein